MYRLPELKVTKQLKRVAVLTSGGDAPGMNAAIRAVVRTGKAEGIDMFGVYRGYSGLVESDVRPVSSAMVANILQRGGTCLKSDRCEGFREAAVRWDVADMLKNMGIDALVVIGGDGSLTGAHLLEKETGFPVIGLPGTIDNDIAGTDDTIGFDTAVNTALEAIDRIRDTANSHERLFLVEVMGRNSGFIAAQVGIAGGAEKVLVPDAAVDVAQINSSLQESRAKGKESSIILIAEGELGRTQNIAEKLKEYGHQPRVCILGHTQRGGAPTGHDRVLASSMGAMAVKYLQAGVSNAMVSVKDNALGVTPLEEVVDSKKNLEKSVLDLVYTLQG